MRTQHVEPKRHVPIVLVAVVSVLAQSPLQAATVPPGFTETLVASGLSSPTAMQFAPDGRLFVAEQGGRLRVIKDGVLLPTPFLTLTVSSGRRARAARRGLRPGLRDESVRLRLLHRDDPSHSQPDQSIHRQRRRRRGRQRDGSPRSQQPERRDESQRRRARLWRGRQAVRRRRGERQRRQRAVVRPTCSARCCGSTATDRFRPTTRSSGRRRGTTGPSTRSACATPSRSPSARTSPACSSTTSARTRGKRSTTASRVPTTDGRIPKGRRPTRDSSARGTAYNHSLGCAITGGTFYAPSIHPFPDEYLNDYFFADYCGGWIRRLDPAAGNTRRAVCQRHSVSRRSQGRQRRQPVLPGARIGCLDRRRLSDLVRGEYAEHHHAPVEPDGRAGRVGDVQRARIGPASAPLSVAAQRRQHLRRNGAGLHVRRRRRRQRRALPRHRQQRCRQRAQQRSDLDGHLEPAAHGHDHAAGSRARCTAAAASSATPEPPPIRRTGRCRRAPSPGASTSTTTRTSTRSSRSTTGATSGSFTVPTTGHPETNVWYRIFLTVRDSPG